MGSLGVWNYVIDVVNLLEVIQLRLPVVPIVAITAICLRLCLIKERGEWIMGLIFSCQNAQNCLARFENGIVYVGHSTLTCGSYAAGKVYDGEGNIIATYCNNALHPTDKDGLAFVVKNNCICRGETPYAFFQGNTEGACVAAFLHYRKQMYGDAVDRPEAGNTIDDYWSFDVFWKNINERIPAFLKIIIILAVLLVGYNLFQLPTVVAYLFEEEIGLILICVWGGAFLFGFRRNTYPLFKDMRHILAWLWEYLVPYLHVAWIVVVIICIYSVANGFFSFSYLAGVIYYLPATVLPLTMPLYLINLVRSLYLLYRYKR